MGKHQLTSSDTDLQPPGIADRRPQDGPGHGGAHRLRRRDDRQLLGRVRQADTASPGRRRRRPAAARRRHPRPGHADRHPGRRRCRGARPGLRTQDRRRVRRRRHRRPEDLRRGRWRPQRRQRRRDRRARHRRQGRPDPQRRGRRPDLGRRSAGHRRVLRRHLPVDRRHVGRQRLRPHDGQRSQAVDAGLAHPEPGRLLGVVGRRRSPITSTASSARSPATPGRCFGHCSGCTPWPSPVR